MKAVKGDMRGSFESLKVCARVLMRFPGICRYRPHLVHAVLAASASSVCRKVYNPVRAIYNSILPWNGTPAPPIEEWDGMRCICNHIFCRSLQAGIMSDLTARNLGFAHQRTAASPGSAVSSPGRHTYLATGASRQSLDGGMFRPTSAASSAGVPGMATVAPSLANVVPLPSPTLTPPSPNHI